MTPTERLNAAIARAEAATEGPWVNGVLTREGDTPEGVLVESLTGEGPLYGGWLEDGQPDGIVRIPFVAGDAANSRNNAAFIAAARTDVPDLAGALRAVLALCDEAEAAQTAGLRSEAAIRAALSFGALRVGQIRTAITDALGDK